MTGPALIRSTARAVTVATVAAAAAYAAYVTNTWKSYGNPPAPGLDGNDELLDRFMPEYDVVDRRSIAIAAPAAEVLAAAKEQDLFDLPLVHAIFRARELALGASPGEPALPGGLLAATRSLGWGVLADRPDREIVVGAVTKPWEPHVTFRALPPDEFAAYHTPGDVKIIWTLRVDPVDSGRSIFRTETRAVATDPIARERFRSYWSLVSPGVSAIRWLSLRALKRDAERRSAGEEAA